MNLSSRHDPRPAVPSREAPDAPAWPFTLRDERTTITDAMTQQAHDFVDATGLVDRLAPLLHRPLGRPRRLSVEGLLVGMVLCSWLNNGAVFLDRCTDILNYAIPPHWRERFNLTPRNDDAAGFEAAYATVRRLFHAMLAVMDPSVLPKNHRLDKSQVTALLAQTPRTDLGAARELLCQVSNQVIDASLQPVADSLDQHWDGSVAVDGTAIATYARGVRSSAAYTATDPDAAWYVREGEHRDPSPAPSGQNRARAKSQRATRTVFGYEATLVIARNPQHDSSPRPNGACDPRVLPTVIIGMTLDKPGHRPGPNAIAVLADIRRRGHKAGYLAADRAYSNTKPAEFQLPARAMGYRPVFDYPRTRLGIQGSAQGALLIDGTWYCPQMPQPLITATADALSPGEHEAIDGQTWTKRIAARRAFALAPKGRPDEEGHQRYSCPAAAGRAQCPHKPDSMASDPRLPLIDPAPAPTGPPPVCSQKSITIAPEHGAKDWQPLAYGSPEWARIYHRLRNSVESAHARAKDMSVSALEQMQTRRIRGIAAQTVLAAFQIAYVNRWKIHRWLNQLPDAQGMPRRRARRRQTKPLGTWTPRPSTASRG